MEAVSFAVFQQAMRGNPEVPLWASTTQGLALCEDAENLHFFFCPGLDEVCFWGEEENSLPLSPWVLPQHMRWLSLAARLRAGGVNVEEALSTYLTQEGALPLLLP